MENFKTYKNYTVWAAELKDGHIFYRHAVDDDDVSFVITSRFDLLTRMGKPCCVTQGEINNIWKKNEFFEKLERKIK